MAEVIISDYVDELGAPLAEGAGVGATVTVKGGCPAGYVGGTTRVRVGHEIVRVTLTAATTWTVIAREAEDADRFPKQAWPADTPVLGGVLTPDGFGDLAAVAASGEVSAAIAALAAVYQPLDSDLTAIAALSTTAFGRALLTLADAAAGRTAFGLGTASTVNTGTIGATVPLLNAANTWSAAQTIIASADAVTPASIRQFSGTQSASLLTFTSSDGSTLLANVDSAGNFVAPVGNATTPGIRFVGNLTTGFGLAVNEIQLIVGATNVAKIGGGRALFVGSVSCGAGSVSAPGLYLASDTTTGLFRAGGNIIGVTVSGTQRAQVDSTGLGVIGQVGITLSDSATAALSNVETLRHNSSGTAAAGFGAATLYQLESSTTDSQDAGQIAVAWTVATHASRTSEIRLSTVTNAGGLAEVARFDKGGGASPSAGNTGFMLWDVDNGTLERVTVGAADSGGAGYKVLRIPN